MGAANCTRDSRSVTRSQISRSSPMGEGILHSQSNVSASDDITQTIRSPSLVANRSRAKYRARALSTAAPANPNHPGYRPEIDGLRALAVTSVIGFHAFPNAVRGGFIGVDIFCDLGLPDDEHHRKLAIFDQNEVFCKGRQCSLLRDGMPLFRDHESESHYSEYGSAQVAKLFVAWAKINLPCILDH